MVTTIFVYLRFFSGPSACSSNCAAVLLSSAAVSRLMFNGNPMRSRSCHSRIAWADKPSNACAIASLRFRPDARFRAEIARSCSSTQMS